MSVRFAVVAALVALVLGGCTVKQTGTPVAAPGAPSSAPASTAGSSTPGKVSSKLDGVAYEINACERLAAVSLGALLKQSGVTCTQPPTEKTKVGNFFQYGEYRAGGEVIGILSVLVVPGKGGAGNFVEDMISKDKGLTRFDVLTPGYTGTLTEPYKEMSFVLAMAQDVVPDMVAVELLLPKNPGSSLQQALVVPLVGTLTV